MTIKEVRDNPQCHQIENDIWHNGPVEEDIDEKFYRNKKNGKIKVRKRKK